MQVRGHGRIGSRDADPGWWRILMNNLVSQRRAAKVCSQASFQVQLLSNQGLGGWVLGAWNWTPSLPIYHDMIHTFKSRVRMRMLVTHCYWVIPIGQEASSQLAQIVSP